MIAEALGNFFVAIYDGIVSVADAPSTAWVLVGMAALLPLWRLSIAIAPETKCRACKGSGARHGVLGGLWTCGRCSGSGRQRRIGASK